MLDSVTLLFDNLGAPVEFTLSVFIAIGILIICAKDMRIAFQVGTLLFLSEFLVFYSLSMKYYIPLICLLVLIVLLALSLMLSYKSNQRSII